MRHLAEASIFIICLAGCAKAPEPYRDFELNASFRAVDTESGEERFWLRPEQAVPVLRFVIKEYRNICEGILCEYRATALETLLPAGELGSPQYELSSYAAEDPALQYVVDELFPLKVQVQYGGDDANDSTMAFIQSGTSGELITTQSASTAVITAQDGQLFRALAAGKPDEMTSVDCVTEADKQALGNKVHDQIRRCPVVNVGTMFHEEAERLLNNAKDAWASKEHVCDDRPCHGLYAVSYFGEERYALFNWGQLERFVSAIEFQVCAHQEHDNAWACLFDLAGE